MDPRFVLMDRLEDELRARAGAFASIERHGGWDDDEVDSIDIRPRNRRACDLVVLLAADRLRVYVGRRGNGWELDADDPAAIEDALEIVEAVVAGRVVIRSGISRSRMTLTLADDTTIQDTFVTLPSLLVPQFGWMRWGPVDHPAAYADEPPTGPDGGSRRSWRVRTWIRAVAAVYAAFFAIGGGLVLLESAGRSGRPDLVLAGLSFALAAAAILPAFRLRIDVDPDGTVCVVGVLLEHRFAIDRIDQVEMTSFGLRFTLDDGRRITSILFQDTQYVREPRYLQFLDAISDIDASGRS